VSESVKARGVSSRIVNDRGRVEGVIECHVEGDGLAMVVQYAQVTGIVYSTHHFSGTRGTGFSVKCTRRA